MNFLGFVVVMTTIGYSVEANSDNILNNIDHLNTKSITTRVPSDAPVCTPEEEEDTDMMLYCKLMMSSEYLQEPAENLHFFTGSSGEKFVEAWTNSSIYLLHHVMRVQVIGEVEDNLTWTYLCIGLFDITSYTYLNHPEEGGRPIAWITMHTLAKRSIGIIELRTQCWRSTKQLADCDSEYFPIPNIGDIPQLAWSPLEEVFWRNFSSVNLKLPLTWIWKINVNVNKTNNDVNIQPNWVHKMDIPCLTMLEISGNEWGRPEKVLGRFSFLIDLNLSRNKLESIPEDMFKNLPNLRNLTLMHNNFSEFPSGIKYLQYLVELSLSFSASRDPLTLTAEDVESNLPQSLKTLKLERTILNANYTTFLSLPDLSFLNVSHCFLGEDKENVTVTSFSKLVVLDLSSNSIGNLQELSSINFSRLLILVLRNNSVTFWNESLMQENNITELYITKNFISRVEDNSFNNLENLQILDLSENIIQQISKNAFRQNSYLRKLELSNNQIEFIPESTFSKNERLQEVFLSNNKLKEITYIGNVNINYLGLSYNKIKKFIQNNTHIVYVDLSYNHVTDLFVESIHTLNLSYNSLSDISNQICASIPHLKEIDLGGNNFDCCLLQNKELLSKNFGSSFLNLGVTKPLMCSLNTMVPKIPLEMFVYDNSSECKSDDIEPVGIEVIVPIALTVLAIFVVAILIYVYRFDISYILHLIKLKKFGAKCDERSYNACFYDAFVCYSAKNFSWVVGRLLPALEESPYAYRLCVHDRDFTLGAAIHRNIVASLEKSRKVILVLSNDFVASKWCQWELDMANYKMFVERRCSILLVELERLERQCLPWHLRYLMARITYLQWPSESDSWEAELGEGGETSEEKKQRRLRREEVCLKRIREALGESLAQRRGTCPEHSPSSVLDVSIPDQELVNHTQSS